MECGVIEGNETPYFYPRPTLLEWPFQEKSGLGSTAFAPVSDVSAPVCTNGAVLPDGCHLNLLNRVTKNC